MSKVQRGLRGGGEWLINVDSLTRRQMFAVSTQSFSGKLRTILRSVAGGRCAMSAIVGNIRTFSSATEITKDRAHPPSRPRERKMADDRQCGCPCKCDGTVDSEGRCSQCWNRGNGCPRIFKQQYKGSWKAEPLPREEPGK